MRLPLEPPLPDLPLRPVGEMGLKELERVRLILRGGSIVDWRRLHFRTREEVDRFLRLCCVDLTQRHDEAWSRSVLADAVEYLRRTFGYRVDDAVARPPELHDLFLCASGVKEPRLRRIACIVLKCMHVVQHIEGRDLQYRLAVSEAALAEMAIRKVSGAMEEARAKGLPISEFYHSVKTRESLITKLLAKKETVAAQVYDKTRFRIVTRARGDILPVLYFLTQRLFPFNFVVPGQTENSLLPFKTLLRDFPHFAAHANELHLDPNFEDREGTSGNPFSGAGYRVLNFVVDMPLRLDAFLPPPEEDVRDRKGRITFTLVEFQILDERTAATNEHGDSAHVRYKHRQRRKVLRRLSRGLVVPKKHVAPEPGEAE
jgi:uncharacterized protein (TIGR04552 family)